MPRKTLSLTGASGMDISVSNPTVGVTTNVWYVIDVSPCNGA